MSSYLQARRTCNRYLYHGTLIYRLKACTSQGLFVNLAVSLLSFLQSTFRLQVSTWSDFACRFRILRFRELQIGPKGHLPKMDHQECVLLRCFLNNFISKIREFRVLEIVLNYRTCFQNANSVNFDKNISKYRLIG